MAYTETALYCDSVAYAAVTAWAATTAYTAGQIRRQLAAPAAGSERCFICIVAGTSGGTEPTWVLTKGAKTTDSTVTWMECTALPALNGDSANTNAWKASQGSIVLGVLIKNTAADHYFICTTAGTGGTGGEPSWNTTTGGTTADSTVTWTCIGAISSFSTRWAAAAKMLQNPIWNGVSWMVNANMTVFIGDDHSETATTAYTPSFPCQVLCVDHTAAFPLTSANLKITALLTLIGGSANFWNGVLNGYVYGLQIVNSTSTTQQVIAGALGSARVYFEQCLFSLTTATANVRLMLGDNANVGGVCTFRNCTFNISAASQNVLINGPVRMEGCSLTGSFGGSANQIFSGAGVFVNFVAEGCDFSTNVSSGANLVGTGSSGQPYGYMLFKDCLIRSDYTAVYRGGDAGMAQLVIELQRCDSGGTNYRNERHSALATELTSVAVIRTNGAVDGSTAISHSIAASANAFNGSNVFGAMPLVIWNATTGANRNVTLYGIANDSRVPTNDELWLDAEYLGSSSSPEGSYGRGSKANILATGSVLTADTSAWDSAATARSNTTAYVVGNAIKLASNPGRIFFCTTAGTSAGSEPGGYATAVDGGSVTDGTATFRAGCRFSQTLTLSSPQPGQAGYLYCFPKIGRASTMYYLDPKVSLS